MGRPISALLLVSLFLSELAGEACGGPAVHTPKLTLVVRETAGIRRFGYPVSVLLHLPQAVKDVEHLRLLEKDKEVVAQFRPYGDTRQGIRRVSLDFNMNCGPNENRTFAVEYGPDVKPPDEPRGMKVVAEKDQFRIVHSPSFQIVVPGDLQGLLRGVKASKTDYLRAGSSGLVIRTKGDVLARVGGLGPNGKRTLANLIKQGPLASTLRFESTTALQGGRSVKSVVEMDFPVSKSWVQVTWTVDDLHENVTGLGADLNLNIQGEPALVDFGAGSYIYAHLRKGQTALLRQKIGVSGWETLVGRVGSPVPYVVSKRLGNASGPVKRTEGWAHVMDKERCTAVGLAEFANTKEGAEIGADADGRLRLWKHLRAKGPKKMRFWLHFVDMPVQVGAVTSPQSMMAPLEVEFPEQGGQRKD